MKAPFFSSRSLLAGGHRPLTHWAARRGSPSCRSCYRSVFRPACGPAGCRAHHTEGRDPARWWERQELNLRPPVWWCLEWPRSRPVLRHKRTPLCYIPIKAALYDRPPRPVKKLQEPPRDVGRRHPDGAPSRPYRPYDSVERNLAGRLGLEPVAQPGQDHPCCLPARCSVPDNHSSGTALWQSSFQSTRRLVGETCGSVPNRRSPPHGTA